MTRWGRYMPWVEHDERLFVHPEDITSFQTNLPAQPRSLVFQHLGESGDYIILLYGSEQYRLSPRFFRPVPDLRFGFEDVVRTTNGTIRVGKIHKIMWHFMKERPMYFIEVRGKKISRRYWEDDLELVVEDMI